MAPHRRSRIVSRRRTEDEGDENGSMNGDFEDDSLSDGTISPHEDDDADEEGSDFSEKDTASGTEELPATNGRPQVTDRLGSGDAQQGGKSAPAVRRLFGATVSDTEVMLNGLRLSDGEEGVEEIHFDDMKEGLDSSIATPKSANNKGHRGETFAERKRRELEKYIKERDSNPAFVPTRGGFFLHDKRNAGSPPNGYRSPHNTNGNGKLKTRPYGLIVDSNAARRPAPKPDVTVGQWAHDLHDSIVQDTRPVPSTSATISNTTSLSNPQRSVPTAPRSSPPNRSFSSSVLVGNVPVIVFLPGMKAPIPYSAVPKKQHTRLPQHRPPLRRDKPVRISLPGQPPRYIFPATERSFIFIPRALRPNQQYRQRGRGGFYGGGGRRTSLYGGSIYTPSVAMSRKSSVGAKPVVRLPPSIRPPVGPGFVQPYGLGPQMHTAHPPSYTMPPPPEYRENQPTPNIPMHQPRPQKTVSVADIESPVTYQFNPPQTQQEQPFHHQVPQPVNGGFMPDSTMYALHARHTSHVSQASATPLSQIPERAIHAQPFQPYPYQQPQPYYTEPGYQPAPVFYPATNPEYPTYNASAQPSHPPVYATQGQQMPYSMHPHQPPASDQVQTRSGTVAHESNGTVYYYDTSQLAGPTYPQQPNAPYPAASQRAPQGGVVGMGGMITPPGTTYYYPQPQNGTVYYA
ncbi:hypothetical protein I7I51_05686 [Histoplasma capsulatum]|uniref:Btz domain-containing protein n=1 Tax=Ajellomyces capsulatus TaxID=5037 RepID=A0A8A1M4G2_AJECA|nr:hypothetical protein I7I51_05686 [Histoplasma capsulatum]